VAGDIDRVASHCPRCGAEYRAGFDTCSDCGVALARGPSPEEPAPTRSRSDPWSEATERVWGPDRERRVAVDPHPEPEVLCRLPLEEASMLVGRLEAEGIPARVASDVGPLVMPPVNSLKEVLVPRSRLRDARRVLAEVESGEDRI
jgi:hypothetical protein